VSANFEQRTGRVNFCFFHQSGFGGILGGEYEGAPVLASFASHRQRPAYRAQCARQSKLTGKLVPRQIISGNLP